MQLQRCGLAVGLGLACLLGGRADARAQVPTAARPSAVDSVPDVSPDLQLLLIDRRTRAPLARRSVTLYSDNGRRCIRAPCDTNGEQWVGQTDAKGRVLVPGRLRQASMHVWASGYTARVDLIEQAVRRSADAWTVALRRDRR